MTNPGIPACRRTGMPGLMKARYERGFSPSSKTFTGHYCFQITFFITFAVLYKHAKSIMFRVFKKGNSFKFILLVYFHLLILSYPMVDKAFHRHLVKLKRHEISNQVSFDSPAQHCPVCEFEFYCYISNPELKATAFFTGIPVFNSPAPDNHFPRVINYFSLRAPPVA